MQELNSHHNTSKSKEDRMDLPRCSSVLGSAGSLMTSEAPPPTLHNLKTACGLQLGKVFSSISATLTSILGDLWFDDRIQTDVNPYFIHLIWRLFWLLLPFSTVLEYKANPLKEQRPTGTEARWIQASYATVHSLRTMEQEVSKCTCFHKPFLTLILLK